MGYEFQAGKTKGMKTATIKTKSLALKLTNFPFLRPLTSAYFSAAAILTKPLYIYYQSKLIDISQINEIERNLGKRRTSGFLRR